MYVVIDLWTSGTSSNHWLCVYSFQETLPTQKWACTLIYDYFFHQEKGPPLPHLLKFTPWALAFHCKVLTHCRVVCLGQRCLAKGGWSCAEYRRMDVMQLVCWWSVGTGSVASGSGKSPVAWSLESVYVSRGVYWNDELRRNVTSLTWNQEVLFLILFLVLCPHF